MEAKNQIEDAYESAVLLINPKYPFNVGGAVRACAALGSERLHWTGDRVGFNKQVLPSEEKKEYRQQSVQFSHETDALEQLKKEGYSPVAVEIKDEAENIFYFEHPDKAVYVFGPEDGSLDREIYQQCHRFVFIPTHFCLNLAAAVNVILYDRRIKGMAGGKEAILSISNLLKNELPEIAISGRVRDGFYGK